MKCKISSGWWRFAKVAIFLVVAIVSGSLFVLYEEDAAEAAGKSFIHPSFVLKLSIWMGKVDPAHPDDEAVHEYLQVFTGWFPYALEEAEVFLKYGGDVNLSDRNGVTGLMQAVSLDFRDGIEFLISHGADVEREDSEGRTALFYLDKKNLSLSSRDVSYKESYRVLYILLSAEADSCHRDKYGMQPADMFSENQPVRELLIAACRASKK